MALMICRRMLSSVQQYLPLKFVKHHKQMHVIASSYHTSQSHYSLKEFFDVEDVWKSHEVSVGRPWRKDELRIKSNSDLHKLWYVLLKERNMLFTMESEYKRLCEHFPNPERIEKVEESMENLIEVVQERDRAYNLLETGESGEPPRRWVYNALGVGGWRTSTEHVMPIHMNPTWLRRTELPSTHRFKWAIRYKRLYREKQMRTKSYYERRDRLRKQKLREMYPDQEID